MSETIELSDNEYLFTSESVTEGHPDKMCDQISDGVLDAVLREDPDGRVACETLVNTGLVVVSGEISTDTYVDIPKIVRETINGDRLQRRRESASTPSAAPCSPRSTSSPPTSPRASTRPSSSATDSERRRRARPRRRRRPGNDVRLRHQRDHGADADADPDRAHARAPARPGPQGRHARLPASRRQDPGHDPLPRRQARSRSSAS